MMAKYIDVVQDRQGNAVPDASVTVYLTGTLTLATLTDDDAGALANPVTTDADGEFEFNVDPGVYDLKAVKTGVVDKTVTGVNIVATAGGAIIEEVVAVAVLDVDTATGNVFTKTLSAPSTLTFSNAVTGASFTLEITNSGGARTVTWPAAVKWPGDVVPTPTTGVDVYVFFYNGTVWRGALAASYAS